MIKISAASSLNNAKSMIPAFCLSVFLCISNMALAESVALSQGGSKLVIGKVSSNPKKHYRYLKPIVSYMAEQMQDLGVDNAEVLMAKDHEQLTRYMRLGKVDWVTETPLIALILQQRAGAELLLRKWKKGVPEYHTIFFAHKDAGISSLSDLKGKTIAFQDEGSTSAFMIPMAIMLEAGLEPIRLDSVRDTPPGDKVGYVLTDEEITMSSWVNKRLVQAGAYSNLDWFKDDHNPEKFRTEHVIFFKTAPFPRAFELVNRDLPEPIKQRLKQNLLNIHQSKDAEYLLRAYQKTKKFDEVTADTLQSLKDLQRKKQMVDEYLN